MAFPRQADLDMPNFTHEVIPTPYGSLVHYTPIPLQEVVEVEPVQKTQSVPTPRYFDSMFPFGFPDPHGYPGKESRSETA